jgi:hypothetical protein
MVSTSIARVLLLASIGAASISSFAGNLQQPASFLGNKAAPNQAIDRQIVITDATRYINVVGGTTVRFVSGDKSFSWTFQNGNASVIPFDLQKIAPDGALTHAVTVYVADNPLYHRG